MDADNHTHEYGDVTTRGPVRWRAPLICTLIMLAIIWGVPANLGAQQAVATSALPATATPLVFDGVTVVDVEQGNLLPDERVVIMGNRIQTIGSRSTVPLPTTAQIVSAQGKYLMPGLWDMHIHPMTTASTVYYPLLIANGITGMRDAHSPVPLDTIMQWWREILAGTRVGPPRQLHTGPGLHQDQIDSATAQRIIDSLKAQGANFIKVYPFTFAKAAAARRAGLLFGGHLYREPEHAPSTLMASDSGMRIFDHLWWQVGIDTLCWARRRTANVAGCRALAERFRRNGSYFAPTLVAQYGLQFDPAVLSARSRPILETLTARLDFLTDSVRHGNWLRTPADAGSANAGPAAASDADPDANADASAGTADTTSAMRIIQQVGLPILAGTDMEGQLRDVMLPGMGLHAELALYVAEGLTPLAALQAATLNPAKLIQGTDSLGTVTAGKLADLVLLDANPLEDITNTTTIRAVVANGRYYDRAALDRLWSEVRAADYPACGYHCDPPDAPAPAPPPQPRVPQRQPVGSGRGVRSGGAHR